MEAFAEPVEIVTKIRPLSPDPSDEMILDLAINGGAEALVTSNTKHFAAAAKRFGIPVLSPLLGKMREGSHHGHLLKKAYTSSPKPRKPRGLFRLSRIIHFVCHPDRRPKRSEMESSALRACDFFGFVRLSAHADVVSTFQPRSKTVILSEAPRVSVA